MAWNVVIAGGGFGGAAAARELERLMPKQSARLVLVNDVNFLLYTPFLPEAAAGTLEPRHVVTPLRDMLKRTYLRLGAIAGHDPAARRSSCAPTTARPRSCPTTSCCSRSARSRGRCRCPGLAEHAIGFKSLADAIWLRNHVVETLEAANATEDPARREELLTYVFVGGGYAGLEALAELQDFAADAMDSYPRARLHGMRWVLVEATDRVLPEIDARARRLRAARAARPRHRHPPRHDAGGGDGRQRPPLDRRDAADAHRRLDRRRRAAPEPAPARACRSTSAAGSRSTSTCGSQGMDSVWAIGDCAAAPDPRGGICPPTAQHAVRQGPVAARNIAAELGIGTPRAVQLPQQGVLRQPRPLQGGRPDRRRTRSAASPPGGWPAPTT